ncbi:MAG: BrxE family protein [Thermodesulfobacteriota bacterium]
MQIANTIARLRVLVGYLGEKSQYAWWPSSFFTKSSQAFLNPILPKTSFLSQYYGVREAASIVHDAHIGVGQDVFHLFRLHESLEIELHQHLSSGEFAAHLSTLVSSKDGAQSALADLASTQATEAVGPVRVGGTRNLRQPEIWQVVAAHYMRAFQQDVKVFPFFYREP